MSSIGDVIYLFKQPMTYVNLEHRVLMINTNTIRIMIQNYIC